MISEYVLGISSRSVASVEQAVTSRRHIKMLPPLRLWDPSLARPLCFFTSTRLTEANDVMEIDSLQEALRGNSSPCRRYFIPWYSVVSSSQRGEIIIDK